jgi:hypothetical protein
MLSKILKEFHDSSGIVSLNELSRRLSVERSALDGMLETLVRQGRLREVCAAGSTSSCHCNSGCNGCAKPNGIGLAGKSYEVVSKETLDNVKEKMKQY